MASAIFPAHLQELLSGRVSFADQPAAGEAEGMELGESGRKYWNRVSAETEPLPHAVPLHFGASSL